MGYKAYGNDAFVYLLNNVNYPVWVKVFADIYGFLHNVIGFHVSFYLLSFLYLFHMMQFNHIH